MNKKIITITFSLFLILVFITNILALTASIGSAKMILRPEVGEVIERSILVKNVNDVSVNISAFVSGDLEDDVEIVDNEFTLLPDEEKKVYFTIKIKETGTTETKINIQFTSEGGGIVGLSSTIVIIASGEEELIDEGDEEKDEITEDETDSEIEDDNPGIIGNVIEEGKISKTNLAFLITGIVFVIFIIVLYTYYAQFKKRKTKSGKRVKKRG